MPVLVRNPTRRARRKADRRPCLGRAREDAVTRGEGVVQLLLVAVDCRLVQLLDLADPVHRETAQPLAIVVPRIEVPIVAIVRQPLRRYVSHAVGTGGARTIPEF